ncbi:MULTISPECIES: ClbS/DfsB family four-helix bundle protein [Atlantibacter]|uniref:ClbS/DfsB family four-helix bundle protein n=1 Tax=Atlantibacter TaxID=1903434 RepID=UPI0019334F9F|nr:ClbS/DfsB family four-helix bundle protein [Atlantibacter sp.]MBL7636875.1 ClbS/DfsB family four-helix bundle protein [Atlantibacter hermannii]MBL7675499.1 ClbS/DfsB family four-helix bundle protein [Atlantibacter hermannii]
MSVPENKKQLLAAMTKNWDALQKKLSLVPAEQAYITQLDGHVSGTQMSVANLVSYLIGWGEQVLYWHQQERAGQNIDFPASGYKWNELGKLAQKYYADYASITCWSALLEKHADTHRKLLELVESYSDDALYGIPWYNTWTRGRMIQFNTASPYKNAATRLNALLKK